MDFPQERSKFRALARRQGEQPLMRFVVAFTLLLGLQRLLLIAHAHTRLRFLHALILHGQHAKFAHRLCTDSASSLPIHPLSAAITSPEDKFASVQSGQSACLGQYLCVAII
jgi:hypothetical protein